MKNFFAFLFYAALTCGLIYVLDNKIEPLPALGRLLNPFAGFWQNAESSHIRLQKEIKMVGLEGKVKVLYDDRMVAHIFADNETDLYAAQGYVTAQHRLWQMETQVMAAAGRLTEIIGEKGLASDRYQRRIGMVYGAEKSLDSMLKDANTKLILNSYAYGVNAYIESLEEADLPIEYKILNYKPEKWTPLKTALLLKYMAKNLSGWEQDFEYTNFLALYGKTDLQTLFPNFPDKQQPIVDKSNFANKNQKQVLKVAKADENPQNVGWNFQPIQVTKPSQPYLPELFLPRIEDKPNKDNGSNNWAVSGSKTASKYPILCNDPHLGLNLPSIWYEIQLHCPTQNVYGVSLPGTPAVIIGFNDSIAWGVTNARQDVMDWYKIKFQDDKKDAYFHNNEWKKTTKRIETYQIREGKPFYDTVVYTHHGVVSYDNSYYQDKTKAKQGFALRWEAHEGANELASFVKLNKGKNYEDFKAALLHYGCPAQNFVFASANNEIAIQVQGKLPVKWEEQGKFVLDGTDASHDWQAYIPAAHLVKAHNPQRGFVSSANQHPADKSYPYYIFDSKYEFYRNRRINSVLDTSKNITAESMMRLQNDNFNLAAAENLTFLLNNLDINQLNHEERKGYEELLRWNYYNDAKAIAPVYFEVWQDTLCKMVYRDEYDLAKVPLPIFENYVIFDALQNNKDLRFWDIQSTKVKETPLLLIRLSFMEAVKKVEKWKKEVMAKENRLPFWANYKATSVQHLFAPLKPFSEFYIQNGGGKHIVNATSSRDGASWRMVVELHPQGTKAYGVYPGGQSGNAGSNYYTNMLKTWEQGSYFELLFLKDKQTEDKKIIFKQDLVN
jgi:penicillin amidase